MNMTDRAAAHIVQQAMVARIATLSQTGRPSVTSLYFVVRGGHLWLGTSDWTLAARTVKANPQVTVLLNIERQPQDTHLLRITGTAHVVIDHDTLRISNRLMAFKYILSPGGLRNHLANWRLLGITRRYHAQSDDKGNPCIIDVTPEQIEYLDGAGAST